MYRLRYENKMCVLHKFGHFADGLLNRNSWIGPDTAVSHMLVDKIEHCSYLCK